MLHITVTDEKQHPEGADPMGRSVTGYSPNMSDEALYEATRGTWVFGARAAGERFALITHDGTVHLAIEIDHLEDVQGRKAIVGRILRPRDRVYDMFVNGPSPVGRVRNPVTYMNDPEGIRLCRCGCGQSVPRGDFASGHDQRAIHERIAQIGSVADFLDWFDTQDLPLK